MATDREAIALINDLEQEVSRRRVASTYVSEFDSRAHYWRKWQDSNRLMDAFLAGEWETVFPDDSVYREAPKIPNIAQLALLDYAALASSTSPTLRGHLTTKEANRPASEFKERIAQAILDANLVFPRLVHRYIMDSLAYGVSIHLVVPGETFPRIRRVNPKFALPDALYSADEPCRSLVVAQKLPYRTLAASHPHLVRPNAERANELVPVLEYYDSDEWLRVAKIDDGIILDEAENLLRRPNFVLNAWPSHDDQFRGMFDQAIGVQHAENLIVNLLIDVAAQMVGAEKIFFGIANPEQIGPGAYLRATDPNAFIRRTQGEVVNPQVFAVLSELRGTSRTAAVYPEARTGSVEQSIVSAAALSSLVGNLSTFVAQLQRLEADALSRVLSIALQMDEVYLDFEKTIAGPPGNRKRSESYLPSRAIRGDYDVRVIYPTPGVDPFGQEIRINAAMDRGIITQRRAKELSPLVEDVVEMEKQGIREQILAAGLSFIQAHAANPESPNFAPASALLAALDSDEETILTVLAGFGDIQQGLAPGQASPASPANAVEDAASVARGGLPSPALNVPGVGSPTATVLPSAAELGLA